MPILSFTNLERHFGTHEVLRGVTAAVEPGDKVALVGPNGCGKTTLLKILAGIDKQDTGTVSLVRGKTLGYLPQRPEPPPGKTLRAWVLEAFERAKELEREMEGVHEALATAKGEEMHALLERQGELEEELSRRFGWDVERRAESILSGLGFSDAQLDTEAVRLSGGEKSRGALARILCEEPDVVLLDEPTNHLDLSMLEWLEDWITASRETIIVVSHDRYFLDRVATKVFAVDRGKIVAYDGNYSRYLELREERITRALKERAEFAAYVEKQREFIRRFKAGQRAKEAQGREKRLEREIEEMGDGPLVEQTGAGKVKSFDFGELARAGHEVLRVKNLSFGFGIAPQSPAAGAKAADARVQGRARALPPHQAEPGGAPPSAEMRSAPLPALAAPGPSPEASPPLPAPGASGVAGRLLFEKLDLEVLRGEKVGIIGPNGAGKTTLLKVLAGEIPAVSGEFKLGANVTLGFHRQEGDDLDPERSGLDLVHDVAPRLDVLRIRSVLGRFGLSDDEQLKKARSYSGGERARVSLARLFLRRANFMLLDEPTNHLDLESREALEEAISEFEGTLLTVSHDRYFLDRACDRLLILGEPGGPRLFTGTYTGWREKRAAEARAAKQARIDAEKRAQKAAQKGSPEPARAGDGGKGGGGAPAASKGSQGPQNAGNAKSQGGGGGRAAGTAPAASSPKTGAPGAAAAEKGKPKVKRKHTFEQVETKIDWAEKRIKEIEGQLMDPAIARDHGKLRALSDELTRKKAELDELVAEWETWG